MLKQQEYFESAFKDYSPKFGNMWGINWRAYFKIRSNSILLILKPLISKLKSGSTIIECGCASGDFTEDYYQFIDKGISVQLTDISEAAVEICVERFKGYSNISCAVDNLLITKMQKADLFICMDVFEYFDDEEKSQAFHNIRSCINEEGICLLAMPVQNSFMEENLIQIAKQKFVIKEIHYLHGQLAYHLTEKNLVVIAQALYRDRKLGFIGSIIGWIGYTICKNRFLLSALFAINKIFINKWHSHIVLVLGVR